MKFTQFAVVALALAPMVACSSDPEAPPRDVAHFSAELTVAPGQETVQCKFVKMPTDRGSLVVRSTDHTYTEGSHHFLLFRTELSEIPDGGDVLTECQEGDSAWMQHVRGIVYAAQDPEGAFAFPEGVGMSFEPGEVMLMQAHYLNTTGSNLEARVDVNLELSDPSELEQEAGVMFFYNPQIAVPPMGTATATLNCPVRSDINFAFVASHMHQRGASFVAETDDAAAMEQSGGPLYTTQDWAEPVPRVFDQDAHLSIAEGSTISYTCQFDNPDPLTVVQGPSAEVNEMCMFVGMYWPRADQQFEWCYDGVTAGTGTVSAPDTLVCLVLCGDSDPECSAGCWENACPNAPMKLAQVRECLPQCISECATGLDSDTCATCANDLCPREYEELIGATCE